jgi:hypothetical protein
MQAQIWPVGPAQFVEFWLPAYDRLFGTQTGGDSTRIGAPFSQAAMSSTISR